MRHSVYGRNFGRTKDERKRLFTGLIRALLVNDVIVTTHAKAKAIQPEVEKLISGIKKGKRIRSGIDRKIMQRLYDDVKTRFSARSSGFTRIVKLGVRQGDATEMVQVSFVDPKEETTVIAPKKEVNKTVKKRISKKV